MIWLFDRAGEKISGQKRIDRVDQPTELIERSIDEMRRLKDDGWKVG